jgi:hypothetical protein
LRLYSLFEQYEDSIHFHLPGCALASGYSQVVTTIGLPVHDGPVTILFHADRGDKGLMSYSGEDVYAHTGVITDKSTSASDWKYVKASWNTNLAECRLTKLSANEYSLTLTPDIRRYYGVPAGEKILKLAFVFRNANGSSTGRDTGGADVFADVYEEGLNVSFIQPPDRFTMLTDGQPVSVNIGATGSDSLPFPTIPCCTNPLPLMSTLPLPLLTICDTG